MASAALGNVYLIPTFLAEDGMDAIPAYVQHAVKECNCFFVENERSARRYLKQLWNEIVIDDYEWHTIHKAEAEVKNSFTAALQAGKNIGIISEAGCPGIADPGQLLINIAQQMHAMVKPLTGPNSILLALMASGLNGQQFCFNGYLPIANAERIKAVKEMETASAKNNSTQIFIETPYRNNQLTEVLVKTCKPATQLCIAVDITGSSESIKTKTIANWKKSLPDIHKRPAIFLLMSE
jgi:16S rRNA (cytidine1402-2'-O)-methyltransferase